MMTIKYDGQSSVTAIIRALMHAYAGRERFLINSQRLFAVQILNYTLHRPTVTKLLLSGKEDSKFAAQD